MIDWRLYFSGLLGWVVPKMTYSSQRGSPAPEIHHLEPLRMYSLPDFRMSRLMLVASEEATSGSVMT